MRSLVRMLLAPALLAGLAFLGPEPRLPTIHVPDLGTAGDLMGLPWQHPFPAKPAASTQPTTLARIYQTSAEIYGVPVAILEAQGYVESGYQPCAVRHDPNGSYDVGIAQINTSAHPDVSFQEACNPLFAIPWQARYLRQLYDVFGDWQDALSAYNSGRPLYALVGHLRAVEEAYAGSILALAGRLGYIAKPAIPVLASLPSAAETLSGSAPAHPPNAGHPTAEAPVVPAAKDTFSSGFVSDVPTYGAIEANTTPSPNPIPQLGP